MSDILHTEIHFINNTSKAITNKGLRVGSQSIVLYNKKICIGKKIANNLKSYLDFGQLLNQSPIAFKLFAISLSINIFL